MRRSLPALAALTLLTGTVGSVGVAGPAQAAPPDDFGNGCLATTAPPNGTVLITAKSGVNPLPITAPRTGVITKATFNLPSAPVIPTVLKTFRSTGLPNGFTVVSESATIQVGGGLQTYPVRLPVTAGDLLGISSTLGVLLCSTGNAGDVVGSVAGIVGVGQSATFTPGTGTSVPVVATVEPDADGDGFGDTTQDLCPQSAAIQTACPVVVLDTFAASSGKTITLVVSTTNQAGVGVKGTAKVGGKTVRLKGGNQVVVPGTLARFKVKIPSSLRKALAALKPNKSIKVTLVASAVDIVGRPSSDQATVRLPGTRR